MKTQFGTSFRAGSQISLDGIALILCCMFPEEVQLANFSGRMGLPWVVASRPPEHREIVWVPRVCLPSSMSAEKSPDTTQVEIQVKGKKRRGEEIRTEEAQGLGIK